MKHRPGSGKGPTQGSASGRGPGRPPTPAVIPSSGSQQNVIRCHIESPARPLVPIYVHPENVPAVQALLARLQQPFYLPIDLSPDPSLDNSSLDSSERNDSSPDSSVSSIEVEMLNMSMSSPTRVPRTPSTPSHGRVPRTPSTPSHVSSARATTADSVPTSRPSQSTPRSERRNARVPPTPSNSSSSNPPSPSPVSRSLTDRMPTQTIPRAPENAMLMKHFYVVTVGKMTGVFFENWEDVKPLVLHVSGSKYQAFSTYDAAMRSYTTCYRQGVVRVVRNPGDDAVYGSISRAKQDIA